MTASSLILLAEDDRHLRRACALALSRQGFEVIAAEDGAQAIDLFRAHRPRLVLLDMLMPRASGIDVLRAIRGGSEAPDTPVIVLSNSSREADMEASRALGISGYFIKANLSLADLVDRVAQALEEAS